MAHLGEELRYFFNIAKAALKAAELSRKAGMARSLRKKSVERWMPQEQNLEA
jgi:hypothetical protein